MIHVKHSWSRWSDPFAVHKFSMQFGCSTHTYKGSAQSRTCAKCGKVKERDLKARKDES